jgi:2-iminobutanoate/2-iminopropanoate deaminase
MKRQEKMKTAVLLLLFSACISCFSQTKTSITKFKNPSSIATPKGYSHAAIVDLGNCEMIILSGQVPFDQKGDLVGAGDVSKQTEQVFLNIKNIMSEVGGAMENVIKIGVFMRDVSHIQNFRDVRDKFIDSKNPPTSTLIEVNKLFREDVLIEIEATAIIPKRD